MNLSKIESSLSDSARVWFYFVPNDLSDAQLNKFEHDRLNFLASWNTHGKSNQAEIMFFEKKLIMVIAQNQNESISGCSIDKSVAWIKSLSLEWGMDLLDRNWVLYEDMHHQTILCRLNQFWAKRKAKEVTDQTLLFDTTCQTLHEVRERWKVPFHQSWHSKMW